MISSASAPKLNESKKITLAMALGGVALTVAYGAIAWFTRAIQAERAAFEKHVADTHGNITDEKGTSIRFAPHPHTVHIRHGHHVVPAQIAECVSFTAVMNNELHPGNMIVAEAGHENRNILVNNDIVSSTQCLIQKANRLVDDKALSENERDLFLSKFAAELDKLKESIPTDSHQKLSKLINNIVFRSQEGKARIYHRRHVDSLPLGSGKASITQLSSAFFTPRDSQVVLFYTAENYGEREMGQVVSNLITNLRSQLNIPTPQQKQATRPGHLKPH